MGLLRSLTEVGGAGREESWVDGPVFPFMSVLAKYWLTIVLGVQALGCVPILNPLQYFFENRESQENDKTIPYLLTFRVRPLCQCLLSLSFTQVTAYNRWYKDYAVPG